MLIQPATAGLAAARMNKACSIPPFLLNVHNVGCLNLLFPELEFLQSYVLIVSTATQAKERFSFRDQLTVVSDAKYYVCTSPTCALAKPSIQRGYPADLLQPIPGPICLWILSVVHSPSLGNTDTLTILDWFPKIPLPELLSAKETREILQQHVFRVHGLLFTKSHCQFVLSLSCIV